MCCRLKNSICCLSWPCEAVTTSRRTIIQLGSGKLFFFTCTKELRDAEVDKHQAVAKQEVHTQPPCSTKCISKEEIASSTFL